MELLEILIDNQQKKKIPTVKIRKKTKQILSALGCDAHEISIVITDDKEIQQLNKMYRDVDKPTNVLAFPMQEGQYTDITPGLLGDVVISCETAQKEADDAGITLLERMSQLLIHGILHLVGFDHEKSRADYLKMEEKSRELLRIIEPNKELNAF
ncbi:MAG: rRNA maturation RNase YbeY [Proteobacteria bacterium]|nr:rRNA maturation RNase YbeY [Pseudomonadota bacterium]MBU1582627.1 rRNA maturation RNase YbeY [Pseudomonadota bacterium]MBU2453462.1 rRNA maturation RNase YbeY [Pseudomonadota bacterium]MBU2627530.1 rRNA maturation RNase YbeY [Pseudomonadota bacterium]